MIEQPERYGHMESVEQSWITINTAVILWGNLRGWVILEIHFLSALANSVLSLLSCLCTLEVHTMSGIHLYWHNNPQQSKQAPDGHLQFECHLQKAL